MKISFAFKNNYLYVCFFCSERCKLEHFKRLDLTEADLTLNEIGEINTTAQCSNLFFHNNSNATDDNLDKISPFKMTVQYNEQKINHVHWHGFINNFGGSYEYVYDDSLYGASAALITAFKYHHRPQYLTELLELYIQWRESDTQRGITSNLNKIDSYITQGIKEIDLHFKYFVLPQHVMNKTCRFIKKYQDQYPELFEGILYAPKN